MNSRDDFWDIEKLLPKRSPTRMSPFRTDTPVTSYERADISETESRPDAQRMLSDSMVRGVRETEDTTYVPSGAGLVKRVTVKRTLDKYDFYDSFRKAAILYFDYNTPRCDFAQFYSYMPQYAHLTPSQKNYYFWWRSQLRAGKYLKTDYSYLYLYVYEILNLPDKIPPKEGIKLLCRVWREYRSVLPRIDNYFAIWVSDYCLVHALPCPMGDISEFLSECISTAPIKEFYLSDINEVGLSGTESLLAYLSDYDWRRGKHAGDSLSGRVSGDTTYRGHMVRAMYLLLSEIWNRTVCGEGAERAVAVRDAFPGTLCTHSVKCRLEIEYISFTESTELRAAVSAAVRYTENKLRALLGVRSRLAVKDLPDEYAAVIDRYFTRFMAEEEKRRRIESRPEYEKLYEAPAESMSLDGAREIERLSWANAERLVVDGDEITYVDGAADAALGMTRVDTAGDKPGTEPPSPELMLGAEETAYLKMRLGIGAEISFVTPEDSLAERINEVFVDLIGDVLLESVGDGYEIIEDYREEAEKIICSLR